MFVAAKAARLARKILEAAKLADAAQNSLSEQRVETERGSAGTRPAAR